MLHCAAGHKNAGSITGRGGLFSDGSEKQKGPCVKISAHIKDVQEVKFNPEPSNTARLITWVV